FGLHVDLGLDQIYVWKFDEQRGVLTPNEPAAVSLPPGDGPRHFHFHPNGKWFYSVQEEGSTVALFDYAADAGKLTARQASASPPPASSCIVATSARTTSPCSAWTARPAVSPSPATTRLSATR